MKTTLILIAATATLSACSMVDSLGGMTSMEPAAVAVDPAREAAKAVVGPIVAESVPGPTGAVLTDCIIDNGTTEELLTLAAQGATPENITLVSDILARPETVSCATDALT